MSICVLAVHFTQLDVFSHDTRCRLKPEQRALTAFRGHYRISNDTSTLLLFTVESVNDRWPIL